MTRRMVARDLHGTARPPHGASCVTSSRATAARPTGRSGPTTAIRQRDHEIDTRRQGEVASPQHHYHLDATRSERLFAYVSLDTCRAVTPPDSLGPIRAEGATPSRGHPVPTAKSPAGSTT